MGCAQSCGNSGSPAASTSNQPNNSLHCPQEIDPDDYDIEECIGEGGTGVVYKARHRLDGTCVAMKFFGYNPKEVVEKGEHFPATRTMH